MILREAIHLPMPFMKSTPRTPLELNRPSFTFIHEILCVYKCIQTTFEGSNFQFPPAEMRTAAQQWDTKASLQSILFSHLC